jgi:hypothetical protein
MQGRQSYDLPEVNYAGRAMPRAAYDTRAIHRDGIVVDLCDLEAARSPRGRDSLL